MKIKEGGGMDLQKEREAFEELIDIEIIISEGFKFNPNINQYYHPDHTNHRLSYAYLMGAWMVWQEKAQAVPEWIETAIQPPEEGQKVIISGIYGVGIAEFSYLYKDEFVMYDMGASNPILSKDQVKFWQPLPDAPQEPAND